MLLCTRAYYGKETSHKSKLFCSLSGCYCQYTTWVRGAYDQSPECKECPRYLGYDELEDQVEPDHD